MDAFTEKDAGAYFDSARGIYIGEHVQDLAVRFGWEGEPADSESEDYNDAWDEAEEFLNTLAPEGFYFGSSEQGDWGLWPIDEDEEIDEDETEED